MSRALTDQDLTEAFKTFDTRQRGWLTPAACKRLLAGTFFANSPDKEPVVDELVKKMWDSAPKETNGEARVPLADFVRIAAAQVPEPGSAEEVAAAYNALKCAESGGDQKKAALSEQGFVTAAMQSDAALSERQLKTTWARLDTNGQTQMQFQPFRSQVNGVIHSTKLEGKA